MPGLIEIEIKGMKELKAAMDKFPQQVKKYMAAAGTEASEEILETRGLRLYPPETAANAPPTPYYIRGVGTQTGSGNRGGSENLGTQWTVQAKDFETTISNRASYAKWVVGETQASFMAPKGWRKLLEVAKEKQAAITTIYNRWVDKLLRDIRLK